MVRFRVHFSELEMFYFVSENNTPIADEKQCMKLTVVLCDSIRKMHQINYEDIVIATVAKK